jgi:hypothetical protein
MSGPFATATEFCEYTGLPVPSDLARIQSLLDAASSLIRGYTGQTLSLVAADVAVIQPTISQTTGLTFPVPAAYGGVLLLPQCPVVSIASIVSNSVAVTSYGFIAESGLVYRTDALPWLYSATVTYTHGYAETSDEFKRIRTICMQVAKRAYTFDGQNEAIGQGGFPMESVGFPMDLFLTTTEKQLLPNPRMAFVG